MTVIIIFCFDDVHNVNTGRTRNPGTSAMRVPNGAMQRATPHVRGTDGNRGGAMASARECPPIREAYSGLGCSTADHRQPERRMATALAEVTGQRTLWQGM
ncbi:hypothetical protein [Azospirillum sp. TSH100]|uniref:hypothetical protein n=1 Tax=Azospirillum sp. TSH100 TaxID=652764 RepID=UPI0010A9FDAF|nr:hypothetical protein [Azospirillum sp. TSH100]QCG89547.1 hypothetical protein E6C72_17425 [Azospirillum sp. TSH100]